ncbi:MAG: BON domain-containing protein [Pseudolysinimonas sp.]
MQRRTDPELQADVRAAIEDAQVDVLAITVSVTEGVVVLSGELHSHSERLAAMATAKSTAAPAPVRSELTVAPVGRDFRMSDADIAIEVARALVQSDVPPGSVWFDVANRIVTLTGTVSERGQRAHIRHVVQSARGVDFIDNRITLAAELAATRSPTEEV